MNEIKANVRDTGMEFNTKRNRYICMGFGNHMEVRWEIWEKNYGSWGLRCWFSDEDRAKKHWEVIKDEPLYEAVRVPFELFNDFDRAAYED